MIFKRTFSQTNELRLSFWSQLKLTIDPSIKVRLHSRPYQCLASGKTGTAVVVTATQKRIELAFQVRANASDSRSIIQRLVDREASLLKELKEGFELIQSDSGLDIRKDFSSFGTLGDKDSWNFLIPKLVADIYLLRDALEKFFNPKPYTDRSHEESIQVISD